MSARFPLLVRLVLMGAVVMATTALAAPTPSLRQGATAVGSEVHRDPRYRALGGSSLYDNTGNPANTYYADQNGAEAIDDLHMVSAGSLDAVEFEYLDPDATEPFSATVRIYSNPGDDSDITPLGGPYVVNGLTSGRHLVAVTLPNALVVGADLWVGVQFSSATAGLIINDVPSIGASHDIYVENGNVLYFGGDPKANFGLRLVDDLAYELSVTVVGQGTVTKSPDQASYAPGTIVTLTAMPDPGWHFVGWSGDASGSGSAEVTMDGARTVTATFAINTYALDVTIVGQGSVSKTPDQAAYDHGSMVQLAATPDPGWSFVGWSGNASGSDNPLGVTMDAAKSVTATFAEDNYELSVTIVGQGTVTKNPDQASYAPGTIVTLAAVPDPGWHFVGWSGAGTGTGSLEVTMDAAKSVTATFAINSYALGVTIVGQGSVSKTPDQAAYDHGSMVQLAATPDPGWSFVGWSGDVSGSDNPLDVTMDQAKSVTATFAAPAINLVTNGTFESNLNGWNGYHDATIARVTGGHNSTYSVRVTGPTPADAKFGINDSPSWVLDAGPAGTTFAISAYVRSSTSTSPIAMRIREYMNDERIGTREYSDVLTLSTDWQKSSMQYVSRATGTKFDFQILNTGNVAGDVFLIDDVEIQKISMGSSASMTIERPTASSVLVTDAAAVVEWIPLGTPVDSSVVSVTTDGGDSWSRVGSAQGASSVIWRLPHASASGAVLLVESYSNGVLVGDAVSDPLRITAGTLGVDDGFDVPREVSFDPPRPAPLVTHTTLVFGLPRPADVRIRVLDLQGRSVATLAQGAFEAGRHDITWDGTSLRRAVRPGIYFVCMDALGKSLVRKIAVTR